MATSVGPVMVGTDFSDTAAVALLEARRLGALLGAPVQVVHVVEARAQAWPARADEWLRDGGLAAEDVVIRPGSPWVELVRYAEEVGPALMVLGSHGASGFQPLSIGSTASRVTVNARCPVVLVSPRVGAVGSRRSQERRVAVRAEAAARFRPGPG
jgi:nucleotide-binding universal stress UspA family protein